MQVKSVPGGHLSVPLSPAGIQMSLTSHDRRIFDKVGGLTHIQTVH